LPAKEARDEVEERRELDFRIPTERTSECVPPNFTEILSGIVLLAAAEGDFLPVAKIHSILYEMRPHEPILSGLRFSLTGDVCYSREIDRAVRNLLDWGSLRVIDDSAVAVEETLRYRSYLAKYFTKSQYQAIHSVSRRYHDRRRRDEEGRRKPGGAKNGDPREAVLGKA
jgi:hypothetical protein